MLYQKAIQANQLQLFQSSLSLKKLLNNELKHSISNTSCLQHDFFMHSIACHHAGMKRSERLLVENLFADQKLKILISTATLAWGVNLPAHCVIIKGTEIYQPKYSKWMDINMMDIMQMLGRAGRPQYDVYGQGIIITKQSSIQYYIGLLNEQLAIESQFLSQLINFLNAEIVLANVNTLKQG